MICQCGRIISNNKNFCAECIANGVQMNSAQKLAWVHAQLNATRRDPKITMIHCPYCDSGIPVGSETLCCDLMGEAVTAWLFAMEIHDQLDQAARIADAVSDEKLVTIN